MEDNFLGEIRVFAFGRNPKGWMPCNGQLLRIQEFQALYGLLGTKFGGDGRITFGLPNLQGRVVVGAEQGGGGSTSGGGSYRQGLKGGAEQVALSPLQLPAHTHKILATNKTDAPFPAEAKNYFGPALKNGTSLPFALYAEKPEAKSADWVALDPAMLGNAGESAGHENRQPVLAVNFCISVIGIYPPRP